MARLDADRRGRLRHAVSRAAHERVRAEDAALDELTASLARVEFVAVREAAGLTKAEMARRLGVPTWKLVHAERGRGDTYVSIDDYRRAARIKGGRHG